MSDDATAEGITEGDVRALARSAALDLDVERVAVLTRKLEADLRLLHLLRAEDGGDIYPLGVRPIARAQSDQDERGE